MLHRLRILTLRFIEIFLQRKSSLVFCQITRKVIEYIGVIFFPFFFCFIFLLQWISKKSKTDKKFTTSSSYWFMNERKHIARNEIYCKFIDRFYLTWHNLEKSFCTVLNMPNKFLLFKWFYETIYHKYLLQRPIMKQ